MSSSGSPLPSLLQMTRNCCWRTTPRERWLNRELGLTVVIVTHDRLVSSFVNRAVMIRDGRTSSEFIRRPADLSGLSELSDGEEEAVPPPVEELAVVDKSGRVQLPKEYLDALGVTGKEKLRIHLEEGRIVLTPEGKEPPDGKS